MSINEKSMDKLQQISIKLEFKINILERMLL